MLGTRSVLRRWAGGRSFNLLFSTYTKYIYSHNKTEVNVMSEVYIYFIYTGLLAFLVKLIVPINEIRRLSIYAIVFGAIADVAILCMIKLVGPGGYINYGPFGFLGIPFFPLLAWTCYYILYFYILPKGKRIRIIYIITAASYSTLFANVLKNLGIFEWPYERVILPFCIYLVWHSISTWGYLKLNLE